MSARETDIAESLTRAAGDNLDSLTGTNGIGATINRQTISAIKATGRVLETVGATETGQTLQRAGSEVTRADERAEALVQKSGADVPLIARIGKDADNLPENILDSVETIVEGDFSEKQSTGAFAGRIIGGLHPAGDVRDIAANAKNVSENKSGSYVGLSASVIGAIPIAGDVVKPIIKAEKEVIAEGVEAALKTEGKEVGEKVVTEEAEKIAKEEAERALREAAEKEATQRTALEANYKTQAEQLEKADGGHSLDRHGAQVTDTQLEARIKNGIAPDGKFSPTKYSTKFNSHEDWLKTRNVALDEIQRKEGVDFSKAPAKGAETNYEITIEFDKAIDDGFTADAASKVKIFDPVNPAKKGSGYTSTQPVDGITRTYTKIAWDDANNKWNVVQHFPIAEGWNNTTKTYNSAIKADSKVTLP